MSEKINYQVDETELSDDELNQSGGAGGGPHVRVFDGVRDTATVPEDSSAGTTNVEFTLTVNDTQTGEV